jgi:hypothetical protein
MCLRHHIAVNRIHKERTELDRERFASARRLARRPCWADVDSQDKLPLTGTCGKPAPAVAL